MQRRADGRSSDRLLPFFVVSLLSGLGCGSDDSGNGGPAGGGASGGAAGSSGGDGSGGAADTGGTGGVGVAGSAGGGVGGDIDAAAPALTPIEAAPTGLVLFDDTMILTHRFRDMQSYDMSDPLAPELVDEDFATHGSRNDGPALKMSDRHFVQATSDGGIMIFTSTGGRESFIDGTHSNQSINAFALVGTSHLLAAIATKTDGVTSPMRIPGQVGVYDISDPENVTFVTSFRDSIGNELGSHGIEVDATLDIAFVFDNSQLRAFDVADPTTPTELGQTSHFVNGNILGRETLYQELDGSRLYALHEDTLYVYDVADVANIAEAGSITIDGCDPRGVEALAMSHVLARCGVEMKVFDVADPQAPLEIDSIALGTGRSLRVGDTLYLGASGGGFHGVDVSDPTQVAVLF